MVVKHIEETKEGKRKRNKKKKEKQIYKIDI
jgi:hypothetical protein